MAQDTHSSSSSSSPSPEAGEAKQAADVSALANDGKDTPKAFPAATKKWTFLPIALLVASIDQLGKWHATQTLEVGERAPFLGDLVAWVHLPAAGGALGLFSDWTPNAQLAGFALLSIIAITIIVSFYRGLARGEHGSAAALGGILGGIVSNGLDRFYYGSGLDFLHLGSASAESMPDFNFADVAIILGVVTLIVELLATEMATRASERPRA